MRIIKHGRDPKAGSFYKTTCLSCRTKFEWHTGEATIVPDLRDGDYYDVVCPVCGRHCTQNVDKRFFAP